MSKETAVAQIVELESMVRKACLNLESLSVLAHTVVACEMLDSGGNEGARELQQTINYYRDEAVGMLDRLNRRPRVKS